MVKISKYKPSLFQSRLDFSAAGHDVSLSREHPMERMIMRILLALIAISIFGYLYFVSASVLNVMARREADAQTVKLQSSIADMERQYFALEKGIDASSASALGLAPVAPAQYVFRPGNAASAATIGSHAI